MAFLYLLGGCQRDSLISPMESEKQEANIEPDEISIERAKQLYQSSQNQEQKNARKKKRIESPDWERAKKLRFKKGEKALVIPVFEMPESATLLTMDPVADKSKLTLMDLITPVQLVIYKDSEGKEVLERMYSKSDTDYRKRKKNKTEDKDFTGTRWFEDESGNFKRGYTYENGEIVRTFYPTNSVNTTGARTFCQTHTFTVRVAYYSIACVEGYGCYDPIYMHTDTYSYSYQDCQQKHDDEYVLIGQPGGGSWGSQGSESSVGDGWGIPENSIYEFIYWVTGLNQAEANWIKANPTKAPAAWWNFISAQSNSRGKYMCKMNNVWEMDHDGTNQNAFKHAYWSALNQRSFGSEVAQTISDNHEGDVTSTHVDVRMDLWNNQLGRKVAETCGCDGALLRQKVAQAIDQGLGRRRSVGITTSDADITLFPTNSATTFCNDH